jgi:hypothetical protein
MGDFVEWWCGDRRVSSESYRVSGTLPGDYSNARRLARSDFLFLPGHQSNHKAASVRFLTFSFDRIELT